MRYTEMVLLPHEEYNDLVKQKKTLDNIHINQLMFNEGEKINVRHDVKNDQNTRSSVQIQGPSKNKKRLKQRK